MTDREKLIELLNEVGSNVLQFPTDGFIAALADHLISNGVRLEEKQATSDKSKWISAKEPPEDWKGEGGYLTNYYVYTPEHGVDIGNYMKPANKWLCMGLPCNVTHWMPLPEPPKRGEDRREVKDGCTSE